MKRPILSIILICAIAFFCSAQEVDSLRHKSGGKLIWHLALEETPALVLQTNGFIRGHNREEHAVRNTLASELRAGFSFGRACGWTVAPASLYQGVGVGVSTFFAPQLLGNPAALYVYQGAPLVRTPAGLALGYEWQFGIATGWKHYDKISAPDNASVGTTTTALMGISLKLSYEASPRFRLSAGLNLRHYSNGNTAWPNAGVNSLGISLGASYIFNPAEEWATPAATHPFRTCWAIDIAPYFAYRKRLIHSPVLDEPAMHPGKFGIVGLQTGILRRFNPYFAAGPQLCLQWDESGGIGPYIVEGSTVDDMQFYRPPFRKQISVGLSANAELTMPIFCVNAGIGYDFVNPVDNHRLYQSLTLKTFVCRYLYINTGYRLSRFKTPQNLMIGLGVRL